MSDRGLHQRQRVGIAALRSVEVSQAVERCRDIRMVGAERFLTDRQNSLIARLGIAEATLVSVSLARLESWFAKRGWSGPALSR
jgi:hypothetical protein